MILALIYCGFGFINHNLKALPDDVSLVKPSLSLQEKVQVLNKLCSIARAKLVLNGMNSSDVFHLTCRYLGFNQKHEYIWNISSDPLAFDYQLDGISELFSRCKDLSGDRLIGAFCEHFHILDNLEYKHCYYFDKSSPFESKIEIPEHYILAVLLEGDFFQRLTSSIYGRHVNHEAFDDLLLALRDLLNEKVLRRTDSEKYFPETYFIVKKGNKSFYMNLDTSYLYLDEWT